MLKPCTTQRFVLMVLAAAVTLVVADIAVADTIYMKNGRMIRSAYVRVEGDRVIFRQYGGEVSVPLALVDRIVEDANVEPDATPPPPPPSPDDPATEPEPGPQPEGDEVPPEQTREYWQERVGAIVTEREQVELLIEDLKRTERAFLFSHRSTAETRAQIETNEARLAQLEEEMSELEAEARRLSIPAGWLRIDPAGGGG